MKVLQLVFNPILNHPIKGKIKFANDWYDTSWKDISKNIVPVLEKLAGEKVQITDIIEFDKLPAKEDGYNYTLEEYTKVLLGQSKHHDPDIIDYDKFINTYDLLTKIQNNLCDEIWVWGSPWLGFYESQMVGNKAHWLNSPPIIKNCKNFAIMGLNIERGESEALEAFAHRIESVFSKNSLFEWGVFSRNRKNDNYPTCVGTVHYAPNSTRDYDWENNDRYPSFADFWKNNKFEIKSLRARNINKEDWKNEKGYAYGHKLWWFNHVPKRILYKTFHING